MSGQRRVNIIANLRMFIWLTALTGLAYPLFITFVSLSLMPRQAGGDLIEVQGKVLGARLIAQSFHSERYFWPRPSAVNFNPLPSGGSNLSPTSSSLKKIVEERIKMFPNDSAKIPSELLYASGSGLDPHISPAAAYFQMDRIIKARGMDPVKGRESLTLLIDRQMHLRRLGFLGNPCINVLVLNIALDELK